MPWPEATSSLDHAALGAAPADRLADALLLLQLPLLRARLMPSSIVPFSPHGNAQRTKPTKSSWKLASLSSNSPTSEPAYRSAERRVASTGTRFEEGVGRFDPRVVRVVERAAG